LKARLRRAVELFLHLDDTPRRIAIAFGVGVYIAFHPLLGLHTVMALAIAFAFRLSRAAMIAGIYVNNPWTIAPLYAAGTSLGCWLLGVPLAGLGAIQWNLDHPDFYHLLYAGLRPYLWPYVVGNTVLGMIAGFAAYALVRPILERRARHRKALSGPLAAPGGDR
jgi:uncharacterized protein (DUF2062 family)